MHRHVKTIFTGLLLSTFFLTGCVTPVRVDYDREAAFRFDQYKCFAIDSPEGQSHVGSIALSPIMDRRIARELDAALKTRGYTDHCSGPDFRVEFYTAKKTVTKFHYSSGSTSLYRHCFHSHVGFSPNLQIDQYEEGTFLIDITDTQANELVWRGTYTKRLGRKALNDSEIRAIIGTILDQFPPENQIDPD